MTPSSAEIADSNAICCVVGEMAETADHNFEFSALLVVYVCQRLTAPSEGIWQESLMVLSKWRRGGLNCLI